MGSTNAWHACLYEFDRRLLLVVLLVLLSGIRIAKEYQRAVVFRLGRFTGLRGPGMFWLRIAAFGLKYLQRIKPVNR